MRSSSRRRSSPLSSRAQCGKRIGSSSTEPRGGSRTRVWRSKLSSVLSEVMAQPKSHPATELLPSIPGKAQRIGLSKYLKSSDNRGRFVLQCTPVVTGRLFCTICDRCQVRESKRNNCREFPDLTIGRSCFRTPRDIPRKSKLSRPANLLGGHRHKAVRADFFQRKPVFVVRGNNKFPC